MRLGDQTIRENIYQGAVLGAIAWTVYAIVECLFSSVLPWFFKPSHLYVPVHWGYTGLLFLFYPIVGFTAGTLAGTIFDLTSIRFPVMRNLAPVTIFPSLATLTIVLAYLINFIVNLPEPFGLSELPPIFVSVIFMLGSAVTAVSNKWFGRLRFFINPWTISFLLLGLPWINEELFGNSSLSLKAMAAIFYPCVVFSISFFIKRLAKGPRFSEQISSGCIATAKSLLLLFPVVFALLVISFFLKQEPLVQTQNSQSSPLATNRPNVILIVMDTVRADHLSLYGYPLDTSPNLKLLSKAATFYTQAIASSDMTLPTHASIFTGVYAKKHRAHLYQAYFGLGRPLADKFTTLAEILSQNGYSTLGIVANHGYVSEPFGLAQGFQYFDQRSPIPFFRNPAFYYLRQSVSKIASGFASPSYYDKAYRSAEEINNVTFSVLDEIRISDKPFFLFINYMDAHWPYIPPTPFDHLSPGKDPEFRTEHYIGLTVEVMKLERKVTEKERNHLISQYDGGIAYLDSQIGNLISRLKQLNLFENSLLIITSDHGESFGRRNFLGHIVSVYQDQIHVPLIIKYPNTNQAATFQDLVSVVDLMPTVLDVLGYPTSGNLHGSSLLKHSSESARPVIAESYQGSYLWNLHPRFHRIERAIFSGPYKFIVSTAGKQEIYDLSEDPNENIDLYETGNQISKKLEAKLNKWIKSAESVTTEPAPASKLDRETINRLKSLGYLK